MQTTLQQLIDWLGPEAVEVRADRPLETVLTGVSTDTRTLKAGELYVPIIGERFDGHTFLVKAVQAGAEAVLCQNGRPLPNVDCPTIVVHNTLTALQRLAHAYRQHLGLPVIAVTGSNGKTTTKDFIAAVLSTKYDVHKTKGNLNNHIGLPLTLLSIKKGADVAVVELGMNHPGEIALLSRIATPDLAIITNVGEAHIESFADKRGIAQAKLEIVAGLKPGGILFINGDDRLLCEETEQVENDASKVGLSNGTAERAINIRVKGTGMTQFTATQDGLTYDLPMLGKHNVINALFALAVGRRMGLAGEEMVSGLRHAALSGRRLQMRETSGGMWIIDDSYNSNPTAVKAGIQTLQELEGKRQKWVLLGDMFEMGEHEEAMHRDIGTFVSGSRIDYVFTVGRRARWIHEAALEHGQPRSRVVHFDSVEEAVRELKQREDRDAVLLVKASRGMELDRVVEAFCTPHLTI